MSMITLYALSAVEVLFVLEKCAPLSVHGSMRASRSYIVKMIDIQDYSQKTISTDTMEMNLTVTADTLRSEAVGPSQNRSLKHQ